MTIHLFTVYKRLRHSLNTVAELARSQVFARIAPPHPRLGVPIVSVTLYKQIEGGDVKVKYQAGGSRKLWHSLDTPRLNSLAHPSLYRCFSDKLAITRERTEPSFIFFNTSRSKKAKNLRARPACEYKRRTATCLRTVGSIFTGRMVERLATPQAVRVRTQNPTALVRAKVITVRIGSGYAKLFPAIRTPLSYAISTTLHGAIDTRSAAALVERKRTATLTTDEGFAFASSLPHSIGRATATATTPRWTLNGYEFFAAVRAGVNVLSSQWRDLQTQVARLVRAVGVFPHLSGLPILAL